MKPDILEQATAALKADYERPVRELDAARQEKTRDAVLASLSSARKAPWWMQARRRLALPIAAAFLMLGSFAAANETVRAWFSKGSNSQANEQPRSINAVMPTPAATMIASVETPEPSRAPSPSALSTGALLGTAPLSAPTVSTEVTVKGPSEDELYYQAHKLHFDDRNYAASIAAWDRYLRASPKGRFAPEARYNRAMDLLHLGRNEEARKALEPFAAGAYGSYRKAEAEALLQAISSQ
jgi:tetratricopeptide (TPR) repeat protein